MVASLVGSLFGFLLALAAGGAVAYGAWRFLKDNPERARSTLERLGAQIPKPGDEPLMDGDPVAADLPAFQKTIAPVPEPIVLGAAARPRALVAPDGSEFPLPVSGTLEIGRDLGLDLSLPAENSVSRRHARLTVGASEITVEDLGSTNGTYVSGRPAPTDLAPGDVLRLGRCEMRVV